MSNTRTAPGAVILSFHQEVDNQVFQNLVSRGLQEVFEVTCPKSFRRRDIKFKDGHVISVRLHFEMKTHYPKWVITVQDLTESEKQYGYNQRSIG